MKNNTAISLDELEAAIARDASLLKRIAQKGHNPLTLSDAQKKFINSGTTVWDLVNELTWLGSHKSTFEFENNKRFKVEGGNLFSKTWDLQHADFATI